MLRRCFRCVSSKRVLALVLCFICFALPNTFLQLHELQNSFVAPDFILTTYRRRSHAQDLQNSAKHSSLNLRSRRNLTQRYTHPLIYSYVHFLQWVCPFDVHQQAQRYDCIRALSETRVFRRTFFLSIVDDCTLWMSDPSNWRRHWTAIPLDSRDARPAPGHVRIDHVYTSLPILLGQLGHCPPGPDAGNSWLVVEHLAMSEVDKGSSVTCLLTSGPQAYIVQGSLDSAFFEAAVSVASCIALLLGDAQLDQSDYLFKLKVYNDSIVLDEWVGPATDDHLAQLDSANAVSLQMEQPLASQLRALNASCSSLFQAQRSAHSLRRSFVNAWRPFQYDPNNDCARQFGERHGNGYNTDTPHDTDEFVDDSDFSFQGMKAYMEKTSQEDWQRCSSDCLGQIFPWNYYARVRPRYLGCLACCAQHSIALRSEAEQHESLSNTVATLSSASCASVKWEEYDKNNCASPPGTHVTASVSAQRPSWEIAANAAGLQAVQCKEGESSSALFLRMDMKSKQKKCPSGIANKHYKCWQRRFEKWWGFYKDRPDWKQGMVFNDKKIFTLAMKDVSAVPRSFALPKEQEEALGAVSQGGYWVFKPRLGNRGQGIRLVNKNGMSGDVSGRKESLASLGKQQGQLQEFVVPLILPQGGRNGLPTHKFDLRTYVLVTQWEPVLRAYFHPEAIVRFAHQPWNEDHIEQNTACALVTNTGTKECRWSNVDMESLKNLSLREWPTVSTLSALLTHIRRAYGTGADVKLVKTIVYAIRHVLLAVSATWGSVFWRDTKGSFSAGGRPYNFLGMDIAIDNNLNAWVLEVNQRPDDFKSLKEQNPFAMGVLKANFARNVLPTLGLPHGFDRRAYGCSMSDAIDKFCLRAASNEQNDKALAGLADQLSALVDEHYSKGTLLRVAPTGHTDELLQKYGDKLGVMHTMAERFVQEHLLEVW